MQQVIYETFLRLVLSNLLVRDDWFNRWLVASYVYNQQDSGESGKTSEITERHLVCCNLRKKNKMAFFSCVAPLKGQSGCFGEEMMLIGLKWNELKYNDVDFFNHEALKSWYELV